jgi:hypothetical protein
MCVASGDHFSGMTDRSIGRGRWRSWCSAIRCRLLGVGKGDPRGTASPRIPSADSTWLIRQLLVELRHAVADG